MLHNQMKEIAEIPVLLDSGAGGIFIDQNHAQKMNYELMEMEKTVKAYNITRTENKRGIIRYYVHNLEIFTKWKNF